MIVKVTVRASDVALNPICRYNFSTIELNKEVHYPLEQLTVKEVKKGYKKLMEISQSILQMAIKTLPLSVITNLLTTQLAFAEKIHSTTLVPPEFEQFIMQLVESMLYGGLGIMTVMLIYTCILLMFNQKDKAKKMIPNIIKGGVLMLVAPILVALVVMIVNYLFGDYRNFLNPLRHFS